MILSIILVVPVDKRMTVYTGILSKTRFEEIKDARMRRYAKPFRLFYVAEIMIVLILMGSRLLAEESLLSPAVTIPTSSIVTASGDAETTAGGSETAAAPVSSSETLTVSAAEWTKMQSDLETIKKEMADDKAKAAAKKKEDEEKKYKTPQWKLNGVIIFDGTIDSLNDDAETAFNTTTMSGTKLRQAWIDLTGNMYEMINYRLTFDASNSTLKDVWGGFYNLPSGWDFKVGHFKEPWSGEELTAVAATVFIEKSFLNDMRGICGSRNNGMMVSNWSQADRFSYAAGVFASSMSEKDALQCYGENGHMAFTTRATYLPYYTENDQKQKYLLHLGLSYSYRHYDQENASKYSTKCSFLSDSQIATNALNTGTMDGLADLNTVGFETFWMHGPLSVDAEESLFYMEDDRAGDVFLQTGYVQVAYTLTGESRNYKKAGGTYGRLKPNNPFIRTCKDGVGVFTGPGAWEVAYMCTWVDASDLAAGYATKDYHVGVLGKALMNIWGLNWYLNENCRMMFNYALVHSDYEGYSLKGVDIDGTDGWESVFATRFQVTF